MGVALALATIAEGHRDGNDCSPYHAGGVVVGVAQGVPVDEAVVVAGCTVDGEHPCSRRGAEVVPRGRAVGGTDLPHPESSPLPSHPVLGSHVMSVEGRGEGVWPVHGVGVAQRNPQGLMEGIELVDSLGEVGNCVGVRDEPGHVGYASAVAGHVVVYELAVAGHG